MAFETTRTKLYREGYNLNVPLNYLIVRPETSREWLPTGSFDLEQFPDTQFSTVFSLVEELEEQHLTLNEIAGFLLELGVSKNDVIFIWLHIDPENVMERFDEIVGYSAAHSMTPPESIQRVVSEYRRHWLPKFERMLKQERQILDDIEIQSDNLDRITKVPHSDLTIDSNVIVYDYEISDGINPIPDLFDEVTTSDIIPFAQYNVDVVKENNDDTERYYKLFKGAMLEQRPDYNSVVLADDKATLPHTLYLNVWQGSGNAHAAAKGHFTPVSISLVADAPTRHVRVHFSSPQGSEVDDHTILRRIHNHLPSLPMPSDSPRIRARELSVTGDIVMYNSPMRIVPFLELITNDPLFSTFLYVEENTKTFPEKSRIVVYFRGIDTDPSSQRPSVTANIHTGPTHEVDTETFSSVNVKIAKAISRSDANQFVDVLTRLFYLMNKDGDTIEADITHMVPEMIPLIKQETSVETPQSVPGSFKSNLETLQSLAGDIFYNEWARDCQPPVRHVKPIRRRDIGKQKRKGKQVLAFPKDDPEVFLVCPNDEWRYPGVRVNRYANRDMYPYRPCCYKTDQLKDPKTNLNRYLSGEAPKQATGSAHLLKTLKVAPAGRLGTVHSVLESFVFNRLGMTLRRLGIPQSPNSFIHCVAMSVKDKSYLNANNREEWTRRLRTRLLQRITPALLKQSMYDMRDDDIKKRILDVETFFDPRLFIRALEVWFDCVIYVFDRTDIDRENGRKMSLMRVPRHKHFYARVIPDGKPVVMILRFRGAESDVLTFPHCELIVSGEQTYFGNKMNALMAPAFRFVSRTVSWNITTPNSPELVARLDLYSKVDMQELLNPIAQLVDTAGKARVFKLPNGVYAQVIPSEPLNLPTFDPASVVFPTDRLVMKTFGTPSAITTSVQRDRVNGLWFAMGDVDRAVYCPCIPVSLDAYPDIPEADIAAMLPRRETTSPLRRLRLLQRASSFVVQLVKYLFLVAKRPNDTLQFMRRIGTLLDEDVDSITVYDPAFIPRILPTGSVDDILSLLDSPMIVDGKLLIYDDDMLYSLIAQVDSFRRDIAGLDVEPSSLRQLKNYYRSKNDFSFNPTQELLLGSLNEYHRWTDENVASASLTQRTIQNLASSTQVKLTPNAFSYRSPYLFQQSDTPTASSSLDVTKDSFYIVQNVAGGDKKRAFAVAVSWRQTFVNSGFSTPPMNDVEPPFVVYRISPSGKLVLDKPSADPESLELLTYGNDMYAALLPISRV